MDKLHIHVFLSSVLRPLAFDAWDCCTVTDTLVLTSSSSGSWNTAVSVSLEDVVSSGDWDCSELVLLCGDRLMVENCSLSCASGKSSTCWVSSISVMAETTSAATGAAAGTGSSVGDSLTGDDEGTDPTWGSFWLKALIRCAMELRAGFAGGLVLSLENAVTIIWRVVFRKMVFILRLYLTLASVLGKNGLGCSYTRSNQLASLLVSCLPQSLRISHIVCEARGSFFRT